MPGYKKHGVDKDTLEDFCESTVNTITRIEEKHSVIGVLYLRDDTLKMYTVPEIIAQSLSTKLPALNVAIIQALSEIDVTNELVAYRIVTNAIELTVAEGQDFSACVVHKVKKTKRSGV